MWTMVLAGIGLGLAAGVTIAAYAALARAGETDELTEYCGQFWVGGLSDGMDSFDRGFFPTTPALRGGNRRSGERRA